MPPVYVIHDYKTTTPSRLIITAVQAIMVGGALEAGLKVAALIDLAQRPRGALRGSKSAWACALVLVNSGGALPILYLLRARRRT